MRQVSWMVVFAMLSGCAVADPRTDVTAPAPSADEQEPPHALQEQAPPAPAESSAAVIGSAAPLPALVSGCPREMVRVGGFCIDRYEAHLKDVTTGTEPKTHPYFERPSPNATYVAVAERDVFPQAYISRNEAQAACEHAEKRLCSRGEWMLACRGTPVPTRAHAGAQPCNSGKAYLFIQLFGPYGGYRYDEEFNSPELSKVPGFLAKTGEYAACTSEEGVHDMVGNLHEWVSDPVSGQFLAQFEAEGIWRQYQPAVVGNGIFMGGFYSTSGEHGSGCLFTTVAHDAGYHDYSTGFRCCASAK